MTTINNTAEQADVSTEDVLIIDNVHYHSRLLVGTGKYQDLEQTKIAIEASGAEIVTVSVRRTNIGQNPETPNLLDYIPTDAWFIHFYDKVIIFRMLFCQ